MKSSGVMVVLHGVMVVLKKTLNYILYNSDLYLSF